VLVPVFVCVCLFCLQCRLCKIPVWIGLNEGCGMWVEGNHGRPTGVTRYRLPDFRGAGIPPCRHTISSRRHFGWDLKPPPPSFNPNLAFSVPPPSRNHMYVPLPLFAWCVYCHWGRFKPFGYIGSEGKLYFASFYISNENIEQSLISYSQHLNFQKVLCKNKSLGFGLDQT